jgi:hypothetical protein
MRIVGVDRDFNYVYNPAYIHFPNRPHTTTDAEEKICGLPRPGILQCRVRLLPRASKPPCLTNSHLVHMVPEQYLAWIRLLIHCKASPLTEISHNTRDTTCMIGMIRPACARGERSSLPIRTSSSRGRRCPHPCAGIPGYNNLEHGA